MKSLKLFPFLFLLAACTGGTPKYDATGTFEATEVIVSAEASGKLLHCQITMIDNLSKMAATCMCFKKMEDNNHDSRHATKSVKNLIMRLRQIRQTRPVYTGLTRAFLCFWSFRSSPHHRPGNYRTDRQRLFSSLPRPTVQNGISVLFAAVSRNLEATALSTCGVAVSAAARATICSIVACSGIA